MGKKSTAIGALLVGGIVSVNFMGVVPTAATLEQHLKAEPQDPYQPKIHNIDYVYGPYIPFIGQYKEEIREAGQKYEVPVEFIAGTIVSENYGRTVLDEAKEVFASSWNLFACPITHRCIDQSIGVGQINLSTAAYLNASFKHPEKKQKQLEKELEDPAKNIEYIAMTLADIMHRPHRQTDAENVFEDPHLIAVIGTEYVRGPTETLLAQAEPSGEGAWFALYLANIPSVRIFGNAATINRQEQNSIRTYAKQWLQEHNLW